MKKVLVVTAAIALGAAAIWWLCAWAMSRFWSEKTMAASTSRPWPDGKGLERAEELPPLHANAASVKLTALVNALLKNEAVDGFVAREIPRGELAIGQPPALPDVSAIRELVLREPMVWERHPGIDHEDTETMRGVQLTAARALVATALAKARSRDATAWEELHAAWKLAGALDAQPQMMAQTAALTTARMINAAAWKMPLPAPAWLAELQERDSVPRLLEAFRFTAASYTHGPNILPTNWLAAQVEHDRLIAEELSHTTRCDVNVRANELGVDLTSVWRRAFRYRAEREATANALRAREGKPIETGSRCSDGSWAFDGTTLRFSREIATAPPDKAMPLVLRAGPVQPTVMKLLRHVMSNELPPT
jgi:hypothetical protein